MTKMALPIVVGVCDFAFNVNGEQGDMALIPAGNDPLGRYSISLDFYMMTTEVTEFNVDALMGSGSNTSLTAKNANWHEAALFANVELFRWQEECYACSGST